jgi:hypothetical protein
LNGSESAVDAGGGWPASSVVQGEEGSPGIVGGGCVRAFRLPFESLARSDTVDCSGFGLEGGLPLTCGELAENALVVAASFQPA